MDLVKQNLSCVTSLAALVGFEDINGVMESSVGGLAVNSSGPRETVQTRTKILSFKPLIFPLSWVAIVAWVLF